jgi:hypothetical protein
VSIPKASSHVLELAKLRIARHGNMSPLRAATLQFAILLSQLPLAGYADTNAPVFAIEPNSAWREATTLKVVVLGGGFGVDSTIRFLVAGTDKLGGIVVNRVRLESPTKLIAELDLSTSGVPGAYDVEVSNTLGGTTRAKRAFVIEPYSWAARFGCSGAESWRRRIPCRRGAID